MSRRRDLRRCKLEVLLNKDSYGVNVGSRTTPSKVGIGAAQAPAAAAAVAAAAAAGHPAMRRNTSSSASDGLDELKSKYEAMKASDSTLDRSTPLRQQRKQLLSRSLNSRQLTKSGSALTSLDELSRSSAEPYYSADDEVVSSKSSKPKMFGGRRAFAEPLRRWKDSRKPKGDLSDNDRESESDSHRKRLAKALLNQIKLPRRLRYVSEDHATNANMDRIDGSTLQANEDADDASADMRIETGSIPHISRSLPEASSSMTEPLLIHENSIAATEPLSPILQPFLSSSAKPTAESPQHFSLSRDSLPDNTSGSVSAAVHSQGQSALPDLRNLNRRIDDILEATDLSLHDIHRRIDECVHHLQHLDELDQISGLREEVSKLQRLVREAEDSHRAAMGDYERRMEARLEKITSSFKKSLDAVADKVGMNNRVAMRRHSASDYLLSWFVTGLSTLLLPFGYIYHIMSSRCRNTKKRVRRNPGSTSALLKDHSPQRRRAHRERELKRRNSGKA